MDENSIKSQGGIRLAPEHQNAPKATQRVPSPIPENPVTSNTPRTDAAVVQVGRHNWLPVDFGRELELEYAEWRRDAEALYKFLHACFPDVPTGTAMALANHEKLVSQHRLGRTE